jgi:vanillate O-demethylase monooxygenase subunit
MFLRNYWYVAAFDHEVGRNPAGYILLNEPVVLFRKRDGAPVALEDRCAHRRMPLSKGQVLGDRLVCGYHGLTYDCEGTCIHVPGQRQVPPFKLKTYPVVERHKCIWIWMGDRARVDESLIPDFNWSTDPGWGDRERLRVDCHYQLISDNLGDLSHLAYVHSKNVGSTALAEFGEVETVVRGENVVVSRWTLNKPPPPAYVEAGGFTTNIDRWQISDFSPPSNFKLNFGAAPAGNGGREGREHRNRWGFKVNQWTTPETEKTTHYFWAIAPDFGPNRDTSTAPSYFKIQHAVVAEDVAIFEAQQRIIDLDPGAPIGIIDADSGVVAARQMVAQLLAKERGE